MKRGLVILGLAIAGLSGCKSVKYVQYSEIVLIDSVSTQHEDRNNPGTLLPNYDTIRVGAYYSEAFNKKGYVGYNIKYKILNK